MQNIDKLMDLLSKCKIAKSKKYKKGEVISTYISNRTHIGIIVEGNADLIRYDYDGNRNIIERFDSGDIYGEIFHESQTVNGLLIEAVTNVIVVQLDYQMFSNQCSNNCPIHSEINIELNKIILEKIKYLNTRIELLTKRSTREKILAYFTLVSKGRINKSFRIPFSYTDLADYLNVDRSAMTREIKSLVEDGFIEKNNRNIKILY